MPAEHGAWGILLIPALCSALVARAGVVPFLLVLICALGLFILRGSCDRAAHVREVLTWDHALLVAGSGSAACALLFVYGRSHLWWLGGLGALLFFVQLALLRRHGQHRTEKRSLPAELAGAALLTLTAPAAWIAQRGALDQDGASLWLFNLLFFAGGVLYVKYRVRGLLAHRTFAGAGERARFVWPVLLYHSLLAVFVASWGFWEYQSALIPLAFAPGILRASGLIANLGKGFPIKRLGWSEVIQAVVFAGILTAAMG